MNKNPNDNQGKNPEKTPDSINITVLGSGTCVPSLTRGACSLLAEIEGKKLLFDCGSGVLRKLLEAGTTIFDISAIFISHFHPDHVSDLIPFLFATKYPGTVKRDHALTIVAGKGFHHFLKILQSAFSHWLDFPENELIIMEMDTCKPETRQFENMTVSTAPVDHNPESLAFRITHHEGASFVYSGDTDVCDTLMTLADNTDLLICECALPDAMKVPGHLCPAAAGRIAAQAHVKKLILTHFYPECDRMHDQSDIIQECRKTWNGPLVLAKDLMRISVPIS